jgi:hypothetical protein
MQVRIEKLNTLTEAIRIATDLETQQAGQRTGNKRRAHTHTWMGSTQIFRIFIPYQKINRENQNNKPTIDNQHRLQSIVLRSGVMGKKGNPI